MIPGVDAMVVGLFGPNSKNDCADRLGLSNLKSILDNPEKHNYNSLAGEMLLHTIECSQIQRTISRSEALQFKIPVLSKLVLANIAVHQLIGISISSSAGLRERCIRL